MRKFLRYFNMFDLDLTLRSYKSPIIRILVSLLVATAVCIGRVSVTIENKAVNIIVSALALIVVIMCILCFFIASVEALQVGENRRKDQARAADKYK